MNIQQRLEIFLSRLRDAPVASSAEEAMSLICRLIEEVEDEFCPLPREVPPPKIFTGRMYAPQADRTGPFGRGGLAAEARHHRIVCLADGGITIVHKPSNALVLHKPGKR